LEDLPDALFIIDIVKEDISVAEGRRTGVPIIGLVDTDANPDLIDHVIPGNDDAIRSIRLMCSRIADAAIEGRQRYEASLAEAEAAADVEAEEIEEEEMVVETEEKSEAAEPTEPIPMGEDTIS
jgi:small subunit ribosomal protein S2